MERIAALLLCAIMLLSLCACGKSEAVSAAENAIKDIGEVTAASGDANLAITRSNLLHFPSSDRSSSQASEYFPQLPILDAVGAEAVDQVLQFRGHYLPSSPIVYMKLQTRMPMIRICLKKKSYIENYVFHII